MHQKRYFKSVKSPNPTVLETYTIFFPPQKKRDTQNY